MPVFRTTTVKLALAAAFVFLLPASVGSLKLRAQQPSSAQDSRSSDSATRDSAAEAPQLPSQETAEHRNKLKENAETSEQDEVKNSAVVRSIAGKLGLTVVQAYWICILLNFGIVLFAVVYGLRKKLPGIFKSRTAAIQNHLEEARRTSEEARRRLAEVEARLSRLDEEIEAMKRQAEEGGRAEDQRVLAEAEQERKRIVEAAEQEIAMAAGAARRDLQTYAAELAVDLARKKIRVGTETDQGLVREFTSWLGKDGN